jgi:hypothetical protein
VEPQHFLLFWLSFNTFYFCLKTACTSGGLAAISVFDMTVVFQVNDYDVETELYTVTVSKAGEQRSEELHQAEILALPFGKKELGKFKKQPPTTNTSTPLLNTPDTNWPFDITGEPIVTVELKKQLMGNFLNATSASALKLRVCAVCEGEKLQSKGCTLPIANLPNAHVLHRNPLINEPCLYVEDIDADGNVFLCRACELSLNKQKPPPCSIYKIQLGALPDELKDLTFPEMMLISPVMCKSYVLKLVSFAGPASAQRAVKGNCIAFMSDVQSVVKQVINSLNFNFFD